jgi:hypothetical protein
MSKTITLDDDGCIEVVYNAEYGGFGISKKALMRMIELGSIEAKDYFDKYSTPEYSGFSYVFQSCLHYINRYDPILIQVVKELGTEANGQSARLAIAKINLDDHIDIEDHDGYESVVGARSTKVWGK